jgi:hypothetical protein
MYGIMISPDPVGSMLRAVAFNTSLLVETMKRAFFIAVTIHFDASCLADVTEIVLAIRACHMIASRTSLCHNSTG